MKQLRLFLIPLFAALFSMTAFAETVNFKVNLSNPASLTCTVNGTERQLAAGDNDFSVEAYSAVSFKSVPPYYISGVTNANGTPQSIYGGEWNLYPGVSDEGNVYKIAVINIENERDSEFTINVDDPTLVNARLSGWDQTVNLKKGANTVPFSYISEEFLYISSAMDKPLYEVKANGVNVADSYGTYTIHLEEGCVVDITAAIPDKDVNVSFKYSENGTGAISAVSIDGTAVDNFDGISLKMKAGQTLSFNSDPDYKIDSAKIDGTSISWTGGYAYRTIVMADMEIEIAAHPYAKLPFKVIIDDPTNIAFYRGYEYQNDIITLAAGENNLEISEASPTVSWKAIDGCYITSVNINGTPLSSGTWTEIKENTVIEFVTGKIVMDKKAVVWIDKREAADVYFSIEGADRTRIDIETGYNVIPFYDGMNPFNFGWYSNNPNNVNLVYLDGEPIEPAYPGSTNYSMTIPDNGVVKIFLAEEPVKCNVAFTVEDGIDATVTQDIVKTVADWRAGIECFKGTKVAVSGEGIEVSVGGTKLAKDSEGDYVFTVEEQTTSVNISKDPSAGIGSIETDNAADDAVYTLMGIRVGTRSSMRDLAPGIYIINGKKVVNK